MDFEIWILHFASLMSSRSQPNT